MYGPMWVHPSVVINFLPGSGKINTTIKSIDAEVVPITVSRYGCFLEVDNSLLNIGVRPILFVNSEWVLDTYRPSYLISRQQYLIRLLSNLHPIMSDIFPKLSGLLS